MHAIEKIGWGVAGVLLLVVLTIAPAHGIQGFCPRLEGVNTNCSSSSTTLPGGGKVCTPSDQSINCYVCTSTSTVTVASYGSECHSWSCKVTTTPEGLPVKTAVCGESSSCCTESQESCCTGYDTVQGTQHTNEDCSVQSNCPSGGSSSPPSGCSGGGGSCGGASSCQGDASPPGDC